MRVSDTILIRLYQSKKSEIAFEMHGANRTSEKVKRQKTKDNCDNCKKKTRSMIFSERMEIVWLQTRRQGKLLEYVV